MDTQDSDIRMNHNKAIVALSKITMIQNVVEKHDTTIKQSY